MRHHPSAHKKEPTRKEPLIMGGAVPAQGPPLVGHGYERADICSGCGGKLRAGDDHYHTTTGTAAVCCKCGGHKRSK